MPVTSRNRLRKKTPRKPVPAPMMPEDYAAIKQMETERKDRVAKMRQNQQKLKIVPGPVSLQWTVDPDSTDFHQAMDKILETQWKEIPEKGIGRQTRADVYNWRKSLPPLVMVTHLHAVFLNDSTFVEREIRKQCQAQAIRRLMVNVVDGGELVIKAGEYYRIVDEWMNDENRQVFELFKDLLTEMPEALSLSIYDLESRPKLAENRSMILSAGFLTLKTGHSDTFNISIPNIGPYLRLVSTSRKWVQKNLAKSAWKELPESKLQERWESNKTYWKDFRGANLEWTLCDCYGGGWCEPFNTPVGRGWKLTGKR